MRIPQSIFRAATLLAIFCTVAISGVINAQEEHVGNIRATPDNYDIFVFDGGFMGLIFTQPLASLVTGDSGLTCDINSQQVNFENIAGDSTNNRLVADRPFDGERV